MRPSFIVTALDSVAMVVILLWADLSRGVRPCSPCRTMRRIELYRIGGRAQGRDELGTSRPSPAPSESWWSSFLLEQRWGHKFAASQRHSDTSSAPSASPSAQYGWLSWG